MAQSLSRTFGIWAAHHTVRHCIVRQRAGADGGLFYHKLPNITAEIEIKLSAGGYHFRERCQYVLYPSPPPNQLPWYHLVTSRGVLAAMRVEEKQQSLLRSLGQILPSPPTSSALLLTTLLSRSTASQGPLIIFARAPYR